MPNDRSNQITMYGGTRVQVVSDADTSSECKDGDISRCACSGCGRCEGAGCVGVIQTRDIMMGN